MNHTSKNSANEEIERFSINRAIEEIKRFAEESKTHDAMERMADLAIAVAISEEMKNLWQAGGQNSLMGCEIKTSVSLCGDLEREIRLVLEVVTVTLCELSGDGDKILYVPILPVYRAASLGNGVAIGVVPKAMPFGIRFGYERQLDHYLSAYDNMQQEQE